MHLHREPVHRQGRQPACRHQHGFTLIELLVVVAITSLLISAAVPSLRDLVQRNRVASEVNSMVSDLQFARSEAIKRGLPVSICASADGATCLGTTAWDKGWLVFSDADGSGTINGSDKQLRIRAGWKSGDTFQATQNTSAITYSSDGFAMNLPTSGNVVLPLRTSPVNDSATRCLTLNRVGRHTIQSAGTGACT